MTRQDYLNWAASWVQAGNTDWDLPAVASFDKEAARLFADVRDNAVKLGAYLKTKLSDSH